MFWKKIYLLVMMAAIALFVGCNEEITADDVESKRGEGNTISLIATIPDEEPQTRVALSQEGKNISLVWEENDRIQLLFIQGNTKIKQEVTINDISENGKKATFNITLPEGIGTGEFDLYGVYGGDGIDDTNPALAKLPENPGNANSLESVDMMLYFEKKGLNTNNLQNVGVAFKHLGSLFSITVKYRGDTPVSGLNEARLTSTASGWAYNSGSGGGSFDLVNKTFVNPNSAGDHISFKAEKSTLAKDESITFWGWYPPLPDKTWPALNLQLLDNTGNTLISTTVPKEARTAPTATGKSFYFYATWDTELRFTQEDKPVKKWIALGNSITKHAANNVFWWGEWGMAATVREKDYVHVLNSLLEEEQKTTVSFNAVNIAAWERDFTGFNKESIRSHFAGDEDVVLIRLGENVPSNEATYAVYKEELTKLVTFLKGLTPNATFVLTGNFWTNPTKDAIQEAVADENNCIWVPLSHLDTPQNKSTLDTQVFGDDGLWHTISEGGTTAPGVANHPGDMGMRNIATAIFNGIKNPNPNPNPNPDYVPEIISLDWIPTDKWNIVSRNDNYVKFQVIGGTPYVFTKALTKKLPAGAVILSLEYKSDKPTGDQFKAYFGPSPSEARVLRFPGIPANASGEWATHTVDLSPLFAIDPTWGEPGHWLMLVFGDGNNPMGMTMELQNIQIKMKK